MTATKKATHDARFSAATRVLEQLKAGTLRIPSMHASQPYCISQVLSHCLTRPIVIVQQSQNYWVVMLELLTTTFYNIWESLNNDVMNCYTYNHSSKLR